MLRILAQVCFLETVTRTLQSFVCDTSDDCPKLGGVSLCNGVVVIVDRIRDGALSVFCQFFVIQSGNSAAQLVDNSTGERLAKFEVNSCFGLPHNYSFSSLLHPKEINALLTWSLHATSSP